jgi:hypothetical protein
MKIIFRMVFLLIFWASTANCAWAYLDPVSISFLVQGIVGVIAAAMAGIRSLREKVLGVFLSIFKSKNEKNDSNER